MIRLLLYALSAITTLTCGVLAADPTQEGSNHSLMQHEEIFEPAWCVASYGLVLRSLPSATPPIVAEDLMARRDHFRIPLFEYLKSEGHSYGEVLTWLVYVSTVIEFTHTGAQWMEETERIGCKDKSNIAAIVDEYGSRIDRTLI